MIPDDLPISEVMVLLDDAVVEGFKGGISDQLELDRWKVRGFSV